MPSTTDTTPSWLKYLAATARELVKDKPEKEIQMPEILKKPTASYFEPILNIRCDQYNRILNCKTSEVITGPVTFSKQDVGTEFFNRITMFGELQRALAMSLYLTRKALGGRKPAKGWTAKDQAYLDQCLHVLSGSRGNPEHVGSCMDLPQQHEYQAWGFIEAIQKMIADKKAQDAADAVPAQQEVAQEPEDDQ